MRLAKLECVTGEAVKVHLTSETPVEAARAGRAEGLLASRQVVNRMRVFVRPPEGKERDFEFVNSSVGVREGHSVTVVRAKPPGPARLGAIALINHSTGEREEIAGAFARACAQAWIPARWRAIGFAGLVGLLYWAAAALGDLPLRGPGWAFVIAVFAWPLLWALGAILDALVLPARQRAAETHLRAEIEGKLKAPEGPASA